MLEFLRTNTAAHARVGGSWMMQDAECPDHVGWKDFSWASSLTATAIDERLRRGIEFGSKWYISLLKPKGGEYRKYAALHGIDTLALRMLVGERALLGDSRLGHGVKGHRISGLEDGASYLVNKRYGYQNRRREFDNLTKLGSFEGLLILDVKDYFPSLSPDVVINSWDQLNPKYGSVLLQYLESFGNGDSKRGLPIGNEASSVLANQVLIPVDRILSREGLGFYRFTDDYSILVKSDTDVRGLVEEIAQELEEMGLALNMNKMLHLSEEKEARAIMFDPEIEKLTSVPKSQISSLATELLRSELESDEPSAARLNFCAGWVSDFNLIKAVAGERDFCELAPKKIAGMITKELRRRKPSDWAVDWMTGLLAERKQGSALRHAAVFELGKLAKEGLSTELKLTLEERWEDPQEMPHIRSFAAEGLGKIQKKRSILADGAVSFADPTVQRGSVLGLRHGDRSRSGSALRKVRSDSLTAAPAAQWVLDGRS